MAVRKTQTLSFAGLGIARKTVERMVEKVSRLYEQGADEIRIEAYLNRWWGWVRGGVLGNAGFLGINHWRFYPAYFIRQSDLGTSLSFMLMTILVLCLCV